MIIQFFLLAFILFVLSRISFRFRAGDMSGRELVVWLVFWTSVAIATLFPQRTDVIAQFVGVERGADLLVYISIVVLFFALFKILVRLERMDKAITKIVREDAIKNVENKDE